MPSNPAIHSYLITARQRLLSRRRSRLSPKVTCFRRLILERFEERVVLHANGLDLDDISDDHAQEGSASSDRFDEVGRPFQSHVHKQSAIENINGSPFELTWDPASAAISTAAQFAPSSFPLSSIPVLNSLVGATASLYLDFDGHFDATWGSYNNITTPVFDQDNDPTTFSDSELTSMRDIWTAVAEDYAPFKINVTTVQPASFANGVSMRVAIGGDGAWSGGSYGGIAYVSSFTSSIVNTSYVFPKNLSNGYARYTAEASSHEAGHSFGLQHQSQYDTSGTKVNEYYGGPGDGRAPIMGTSYYTTRGLWWYGTSSTGPNNYQDDLAIISNATNAFGYRVDDNPSVIPLALSSREVSGAGIIEKITDQDVFSFTAASGELNLSVSVALGAGIGNLNARLELRNSSGILLAANDPSSFGSSRTITQTVAAGDYRLVVASHSGYGDVGQYTVNGTIPIQSTIFTPTSLNAIALPNNQINLNWIDNANNEGGYVVDRSTNGGLTWVPLAFLPVDSVSYSDLTAIAGTTHCYRVSAFNGSVVSSYSNQANATTVPSPPGLLTASVLWTDRTYLSWGNVVGGTGFKIERSSDGGSIWSQITTTAANVTSYQDSGLLAATTYTYRVRASNAGGDSDYSNQASTTTLIMSPTAFGSQDGAYIAESWSGRYADLRIQPGDQKILAAGSMYGTYPNAPSTDYRMAIARYNSSGTVDTGFGSGGVAAPVLGSSLEYGNALALQPDGKAVVAGLESSTLAVARFNVNGSLDTGFGSNGWRSIDVQTNDFYSPASSVGLQSTGKIVVAGQVSNSNTAVDPAALARLTANGAVDSGSGGFGQSTSGYTLPTFGGNTNAFNDLVVQPDDKIVVVGVSASDGNGGLLVARYTASGALDTSFNGTGYTTLLPVGTTSARGYGIARQSDGKIVIVGSCTGIDGASDMLVARYNISGTLDTTFGVGIGYVRLDIDGNASVTAEVGKELVVQSNGKIVIAGSIKVATNPSKLLVARVNADGTPDPSFGVGGFKIGSLPLEMGSPNISTGGVALQGDGSIVVSGYGNWSPAGASGLQYYHPIMMRFFGGPTAIVTPTEGLITTEAAGGSATFTVTLNTQPTADVIIPISSSDVTEGTVSTSFLTFTNLNWNVPQTVTITGVDDALVDGDIAYTIVLGAATSADAFYNGINPLDVSVTNIDNELPTKFYVVNDATQNLTYEYNANGELVESYSLNSGNASPRGAASTAAGDKVWVIDTNRKVYVYNTGGGLLGSWTAGTLANNSTPEGIATNGIDVWIVDSKSDKVYKYADAASRLSGSQNATSSFSLNNINTSPKDIATDGISLWVVNDSTTDAVFNYSVAGSLQGSWTISTNGASSPTGITINPADVSNIWIVDSASKLVYQYTAAATLTTGSLTASSTFALAAGNTNPQGIADPPPPSAMLTSASTSVANNDDDTAKPVALSGVGPVPMPSFGTPSSYVSSTELPRIQTTVRNTDDFMSSLGKSSQMTQAAATIAWTSPVVSRDSMDPSETDELQTSEDDINDLIGLVANNLWN